MGDSRIEFALHSIPQLCSYLLNCLDESVIGSPKGNKGNNAASKGSKNPPPPPKGKNGTLSASLASPLSAETDQQLLERALQRLNSFCIPMCLLGDPTLDPDDRVALICRCGKSLRCPVYTLRSLSASAALFGVLRPAMGSEDIGLRVIACRLAWRLYHISQICAPRCKTPTPPARTWASFWTPCIQFMCTRVSPALSEATFQCFMKLLVDDTAGALDTRTDLKRQNVANPIWLPYCFEALRGTSKPFQLGGLTDLCDIMFASSSAYFPGNDVLVSSRRELAVLHFLSDFTVPEVLSREIEVLCARHIATLFLQPFEFWGGSSFSCNMRHTFNVLGSFGPPQHSFRRVHFMRGVLFEFLRLIEQSQDEIVIGHLRWANFVQLINFVISFVMFHGYASGKNRENFPQPEELSLVGSFLPAPEGAKDIWSEFVVSEFWNSSLTGPVVVHATARLKSQAGLAEGETAFDLVLEDGMLLRTLMELAINIGVNNHVESDISYSVTRDCATRTRVLSNRPPAEQDPQAAEYLKIMDLLQALIQVFNATGYSLGRPSTAKAAQDEKEQDNGSKGLKLDHASQVRERCLPLLAAVTTKLAAAAKEHKKTMEYLASVCHRPKLDLIAHSVLMEGPMRRSQGIKQKNQGEGWLQLTTDSLRCMMDGSSRKMHKAYSQDSKVARDLVVKNKDRKLHVLPFASIKTVLPMKNAEGFGGPAFLIAGEAETFVLAPGDSCNEWVNLLSAAIAHARIRIKGEGQCLQGLHVFPSSAALVARGLRPRSAVWPYDRLMMALGPSAESDLVLPDDAAPLYTNQASCTTCHAKFGLVKRRHHCRNCGCVFCQGCSQKTFCLKDEPVRVCDPCFHELSARSVENATEAKCALCSVSFTFTNRRHHCRVCRLAVCNSCSKSRVKEDGKKKRVCLGCFRAMSQIDPGPEPAPPAQVSAGSSPTSTPSTSPPSSPPPTPPHSP